MCVCVTSSSFTGNFEHVPAALFGAMQHKRALNRWHVVLRLARVSAVALE